MHLSLVSCITVHEICSGFALAPTDADLKKSHIRSWLACVYTNPFICNNFFSAILLLSCWSLSVVLCLVRSVACEISGPFDYLKFVFSLGSHISCFCATYISFCQLFFFVLKFSYSLWDHWLVCQDINLQGHVRSLKSWPLGIKQSKHISQCCRLSPCKRD